MTRFAGLMTLLVLAGPASARPPRAPAENTPGVVNINAATPDQLRLLPRVGPTLAKRIIAQRERRMFRHIRELRRVRGIGRRTYRRLRPHVTVSGPTTLDHKVRE